MKSRPILFSPPMIRALLDGSKTQTRRVVREVTQTFTLDETRLDAMREGFAWFSPDYMPDVAGCCCAPCPYGKPGDLLWVREPWRVIKDYDGLESQAIMVASGGDMEGCVDYTSTSSNPEWVGRRRHARFMPRWASRLTLELTGVRVERLQDISEADATKEGMEPYGIGWRAWEGQPPVLHARHAYQDCWKAIHGPGSWDASPWVWCLSFRVHQQNVDALLAERRRA